LFNFSRVPGKRKWKNLLDFILNKNFANELLDWLKMKGELWQLVMSTTCVYYMVLEAEEEDRPTKEEPPKLFESSAFVEKFNIRVISKLT
jgi:hypothetical protein